MGWENSYISEKHNVTLKETYNDTFDERRGVGEMVKGREKQETPNGWLKTSLIRQRDRQE